MIMVDALTENLSIGIHCVQDSIQSMKNRGING